MKEHEQALAQWLAAPRDAAQGLIGGLLAPLLALAGVIGLIYCATQKLPAIKEIARHDGTTQRAIIWASPLEARASWSRYGGEFRSTMLEFQAQSNKSAQSRQARSQPHQG